MLPIQIRSYRACSQQCQSIEGYCYGYIC